MSETREMPGSAPEALESTLEDLERGGRKHGPRLTFVVGTLCTLWSLFQLWYASPFPFMLGVGILSGVPARGIHLAFGLLLCFLIFPATRRADPTRVPWYDLALAVAGAGCALYLWLGYEGLVSRQGILLTWPVQLFGATWEVPVEGLLGGAGLLILLEATRRAVGTPLVIVCSVFLVYSLFGQSMPDLVSHRGLSLNRLIGYQWLGGEAVFGIPIDVSVSFVFLFVLFGALLDKAGAGRYFLELSFAMVGRYRGGPAKAAILASGMTGLISGSSIANVVTTGTFSIPVMKRIGMPAVKAGAIEVAASTNGQAMPPIMGAAAFIIAEFIGISYYEVIVAAFVPGVLSYIALLYISHLEALKLGLRGLPPAEIPPLRATFLGGVHFLIPIAILVYLLIVNRWTASSSVFYSILSLMAIIYVQHGLHAVRERQAGVGHSMWLATVEIVAGMVAGARNMIGIAIAVGAAGIIVGSVASTGLNNAMVGLVEAIAGGNVYILLGLTAVLCIILGMGLPTTANYLVVASLLAGVLVELGNAAGLVLPLIAVHLYVLYYGLLADSTPPVCLAAFAASAISRANPLATGVQSFLYDIRTAILPVVFLFNTELLLIGVTSVWHAVMVIGMGLLAILSFSSLTQRWMFVRLNWAEMALLVIVVTALFRPGFYMDRIFPPYREASLQAYAQGDFTVEPGRVVRFHVTRETNYGDRFKLFAIVTPDPAEQAGPRFGPDLGPYGVTLEPDGQGRWVVADVTMDGPAETKGMTWGDVVTALDVRNPEQPPKELIYPVGLAVLALVVLWQWRRREADPPPATPPEPEPV